MAGGTWPGGHGLSDHDLDGAVLRAPGGAMVLDLAAPARVEPRAVELGVGQRDGEVRHVVGVLPAGPQAGGHVPSP